MIVPLVGTSGVFKNCVFLPWCYCSDTLVGFGNQQGLIFSHLRRMHNCGGSPFHVLKLWKYSSHVRKNLVTWVFFLIFLPALLVRKCTKIIELIKFIFIFGTYQDFAKILLFSTAKIIFNSSWFFWKIFKILLQVPEFKIMSLLYFEFSFLYLAIAFLCCRGSTLALCQFCTSFLYSPSLS